MEILQIQYFQTIAKYENMSKAAEELHISQPSLSSSLMRLERELGNPLFDRVGRHIELNDYGRYFLPISKKILGLVAASKLPYRQEKERQRLGIGFQNFNEKVLSLTEKFSIEHPEVMMQVYGSTLAAPFDVSSYDFIVGNSPLNLPYMFESICIESCENYVVLPKQHPLASNAFVTYEDIKEEQFCFLKNEKDEIEMVYYNCIANGFVPNCVYITNNAYYKVRFFKNGGAEKAIGIFPKPWEAVCRTFPDVVLLPLRESEHRGDALFTWSKERMLSPIAEQFLLFVKKNL